MEGGGSSEPIKKGFLEPRYECEEITRPLSNLRLPSEPRIPLLKAYEPRPALSFPPPFPLFHFIGLILQSPPPLPSPPHPDPPGP